jgi:lysophospholipase L1-like esterase
MNKIIRILLLGCIIMTGCRTYRTDSQSLSVEWDKSVQLLGVAKTMSFSGAVKDEQGQKTLQVTATPIKGVKSDGMTPATAVSCLPIGPVAVDSAGISFEYKGDGSATYASVMVGENSAIFNAYEAIFPLKSTDWQTMTLRWTDFTKNDIPWVKEAQLSLATVSPIPEKLKFIGFGRGQSFHKYYTPKFSFEIRNIRVLPKMSNVPIQPYSKGLTKVKNLIQQKKPLNILMLGDSITDMGEGKSHGYHCAQLIKQKWNVDAEVVNAGIGGHSVRAGTIVLPRSIRMMPNPDLVCVMYGANDCKAATGEFNNSGFNEDVFARNLEGLIDQVRRQTGGQADIVLISGVPRLDGKTWITTGAVENIVGAYKKVADKKETAFCDTFPVVLALPVAQKKIYYKDTVHQKPAGLAFIGQILFKTIEAAVDKE